MRNMCFSMTSAQVRARTKTVTRRMGWADLKPGDRVMACVKCRGIPKGGKVERITVIECVGNRPERLMDIDQRECVREGFPELTPIEFIGMFCEANGCAADEVIRRIEFKYVEEVPA